MSGSSMLNSRSLRSLPVSKTDSAANYSQSTVNLLNVGTLGVASLPQTFTAALAGRFYENNSLQAHSKKQQLLELSNLKKDRKKVEKENRREADRIAKLEAALADRGRRRQNDEDERQVLLYGVTRLQSVHRRWRAKDKVGNMRTRAAAMEKGAIAMQSLARGRRGRTKARDKREGRDIQEREYAAWRMALALQAATRRWLAKKEVDTRRGRVKRYRDDAVSRLQARARGWFGRVRANDAKDRRATHSAATDIQAMVRGRLARRLGPSVALLPTTTSSGQSFFVTSLPASPNRPSRRPSATPPSTNPTDDMTPPGSEYSPPSPPTDRHEGARSSDEEGREEEREGAVAQTTTIPTPPTEEGTPNRRDDTHSPLETKDDEQPDGAARRAMEKAEENEVKREAEARIQDRMRINEEKRQAREASAEEEAALVECAKQVLPPTLDVAPRPLQAASSKPDGGPPSVSRLHPPGTQFDEFEDDFEDDAGENEHDILF